MATDASHTPIQPFYELLGRRLDAGDPTEAYLELATVRLLDEVASKVEEGDIEYLQNVDCVFQAVAG